ncbi:hypothetical protein PDL71_11120 [Lacibacter sp. MH-610]|uniref:HipA family kinase n=1 Tax=Lacibacter sp. MH-610 TaxID=3020883 RepID=UPI0038923005
MPTFQSIEALDKANIIATNNRPIIIHASDLNFYYCKYHSNVGTANRLFKEWLIASFLSDWQFNRSSINFIQALPEHIPNDLGIPRNQFDVPCFGLQKIDDAIDLTQISEDAVVRSRNKNNLKADLLKLAFFDIWTANEDRNSNNYNIIYKQVGGEYLGYPIDHEACFNFQNFENGLVQITYQDSLIYSSFFAKLFKTSEFKSKERVENLKDSFYLCSRNCRQNVNAYLQNIPAGWNVNIVAKEAELNQFLLNDEWFEECWHTFLEFLQYFTGE